jgi:hypothetical protein
MHTLSSSSNFGQDPKEEKADKTENDSHLISPLTSSGPLFSPPNSLAWRSQISNPKVRTASFRRRVTFSFNPKGKPGRQIEREMFQKRRHGYYSFSPSLSCPPPIPLTPNES